MDSLIKESIHFLKLYFEIMIKMIKLTLVISIFAIKSSNAQFENTDIGARAIGLNGAFTSLSNNSLAVFYNPVRIRSD